MPRLFWALAFPWSAALRYHATACASSCATPWPVAYIRPRLYWALASPWSAALRYHATACASSCATPWPVAYITPRLNCVGAFPWSGALRYHATAIRASARTPPAKRVLTRCFTFRPMASWAPHELGQRSRDRDAGIVKGPLMTIRRRADGYFSLVKITLRIAWGRLPCPSRSSPTSGSALASKDGRGSELTPSAPPSPASA